MRVAILLLLCALPGAAQFSSNAKRIHGRPIDPTAPTNDQLLQWDASAGTWKPATVAGVSGDVATDSIWDTKGDLAVATGANTAAKLAAGANGLMLIANSGQTTGLQYLANPAGCTVTRTDANTLTIFPYASATNPCVMGVGNTATRFVAPITVDLAASSVSANAALVYGYAQAGSIKIGLSSDYTTGNVTCTGCDKVQPITAFPTAALPLFTWAGGTTDDEWDSDGYTDYRPFLSTKVLAAGTGVTVTPSSGVDTVAVDTATTPQLASDAAWSGDHSHQGTYNYCADAGSSDAYACTIDPAITAYTTGAHYFIKANTVNTGAATITLNSIAGGAKTIKKYTSTGGADLADGDIRAGQVVELVYDGTNMQMVSGLGNSGSGEITLTPAFWDPTPSSSYSTGTVTSSANTMWWVGIVPLRSMTFTKFGYNVTTGAGTSCTGGTCGFRVGIWNTARSATVMDTGAITGNDITTTGEKAIAVTSFTLAAGTLYWLSWTTDSTAMEAIKVGPAGGSPYGISKAAFTQGVILGYDGSNGSTGNGASIAWPGTTNGALTGLTNLVQFALGN